MDVSWFRDLAHLARTVNFSHAAELSQVRQSALSRVQTLERWVGVPLVDRSRQPVRLTEAGLQMLEAGQQALLRLETERSQIREAQSLPISMSSPWVPSILSAGASIRPGCRPLKVRTVRSSPGFARTICPAVLRTSGKGASISSSPTTAQKHKPAVDSRPNKLPRTGP